MDEYFKELKVFGGNILAGTGNDTAKATEGLQQLNTILQENEGVVLFLLDPKTQQMVKTMVGMKSPFKRKK